MHTPAAALTWQMWRRYHSRLITIGGVILTFALVYPILCAMAGFDPGGADALDEIVKIGQRNHSGPSALLVVQILYMLFLACGPAVAMVMSLLFVTWMFTFTEFDPKTRDPMTFPARLFTLPISTSFLFWWLWLAGLGTVLLLYWSWTYLVRVPHLDIFGSYQNWFGWMTLVALAQGIAWALAAWPKTRMVLLGAAVFCFMGSPAQREIYESPYVLPPLFLLGALLARAGLQKMRHGEWQGWTWEWPPAKTAARAELRGPKRFASPAQAQLWFEWRRFARRLSFYVAALALTPVALHLLARVAGGFGPLEYHTLTAFFVCLIGLPLFLHYCFAAAPAQSDLPFVMIRPQTTGDMTMAMLKAAGISTVLSWAAVLAALCALPLLGDVQAMAQGWSLAPQSRTIVVLGLMLLTWRLIAGNLCFVFSGNRRLAGWPVLVLVPLYLGAMTLALLSENDAYWKAFWRFVPALLSCLVAVKFLLAFAAFRVSLKRNLLSASALGAYLAVWTLLAAAFLIPELILFHDREWILPMCLGIILLVPLARIGFCPIALAWNRQSA